MNVFYSSFINLYSTHMPLYGIQGTCFKQFYLLIKTIDFREYCLKINTFQGILHHRSLHLAISIILNKGNYCPSMFIHHILAHFLKGVPQYSYFVQAARSWLIIKFISDIREALVIPTSNLLVLVLILPILKFRF